MNLIKKLLFEEATIKIFYEKMYGYNFIENVYIKSHL